MSISNRNQSSGAGSSSSAGIARNAKPKPINAAETA